MPASVDDCRVARDGNAIVASALLTNRSSKGTEQIEVIFWASGLKKSGSMVGYTFDGHLDPDESRELSVRTPVPQFETEDQVLGSIEKCSVHGVTFEDGSEWGADSN